MKNSGPSGLAQHKKSLKCPQKLNLLVLKSGSYQMLKIGDFTTHKRQRSETLADFLTSDATARCGPLNKSYDKWIYKRKHE